MHKPAAARGSPLSYFVFFALVLAIVFALVIVLVLATTVFALVIVLGLAALAVVPVAVAAVVIGLSGRGGLLRCSRTGSRAGEADPLQIFFVEAGTAGFNLRDLRLVEIAASEFLISWPADGHHRSGYSLLVDLVQNGVRTIAQALPFTA